MLAYAKIYDGYSSRIAGDCYESAAMHLSAANALRRASERERAMWGRVIGWREWDWPEGFAPFTAETMAEAVKAALAALEADNG